MHPGSRDGARGRQAPRAGFLPFVPEMVRAGEPPSSRPPPSALLCGDLVRLGRALCALGPELRTRSSRGSVGGGGAPVSHKTGTCDLYCKVNSDPTFSRTFITCTYKEAEVI